MNWGRLVGEGAGSRGGLDTRVAGSPAGDGERLGHAQRPWRGDIQGLRAIAVLSVLLFHLDVWPFRGGFVGVDVFFVISGYLISQGIFVETAQGRFSLRRFYERRARRLLPVFLVTAVATSAVAYAVLFPSELVTYAKTLVASSLFVANLYFYATHNYFGPSPDALPLLHLWSLSVEEQFYLLFPLLALWGASLAASPRAVCVGVAGLASFALSACLTHGHPTAAFYLLPFRAFEFLIGSYLALPDTAPPRNEISARIAAVAGLLALAASILGFRTTMDFPGSLAALPCLGTGLLIWAGTGRTTAPSRLLCTGLLTFVGNISYALYMVHWPLIVLSGQARWFTHSAYRVPLLLALSVTLSVLVFYAVEEPVRRARFLRGPVFLAESAASLAVVAGLGFGVIGAAGFPGRIEARAAHYLSYLNYDPLPLTRSRKCFLEAEQSPDQYDVGLCLPQVGPGQRLAVIWGDSIAAHLYSGLSEALAPEGFVVGQATASACLAALHYDAPQRPFCRPFNERVLALLLQRKPALVIIAHSWGDVPSLSGTEEIIERLRSAGIGVVLVGPSPYYREAAPKILARTLNEGVRGDSAPSDMQVFVPQREDWAQALAAKTHVPFVSMLQAYCSAGRCPLVTEGDVPIEFDPLHFTREGSRYVAARMLPALLAGIQSGATGRSGR